MIPLSVLDLCPIVEGGDAHGAFQQALALARHAERLGFQRYWLAEHHNFAGVASAATSVVIAHIAGGTSRIRVGAGGVMLPNHAPLLIAEQFGTLEALYPGRIDLGLGRAPGTDGFTQRAMRRSPRSADTFPEDVQELRAWFRGDAHAHVKAVPGDGLAVPIWILGSSLFGASLAGALGLPFAFASHFAPAQLDEAIALYRARFRPSEELSAPYVMAALNVIAADDRREAVTLFTSLQQAFVALRSGSPRQLPPPRPGFNDELGPSDRALLDGALSCRVVGNGEDVRAGVAAFIARTGADELILTSQIFDQAARHRSFEIVADTLLRG